MSNLKAFLDMIAFAEGTSAVKGSDNGYNVLFGGVLFHSYADHPRVKKFVARLNISTTAAGRYQLLSKYYDAYKKLLHLPDFSPASQDAIATQQIKECRALDDIKEGRFADAVYKCRKIWASLPNAGYGQRERPIALLQEVYEEAGGTVA